MSGGGQSQGGGFNNYGGGFNNFNKGPNYGSAFGPSTMRSPMGYPGSRSFNDAPVPPPDNSSLAPMPPSTWPQTGGGGNNAPYFRSGMRLSEYQPQQGPAFPQGGIPQMPQAPKAPSNQYLPAGAAPQAPMAVDNNWYERGQGPTLEKPMMSLPYGETQPAPQKQPPPGYYFAQNGQMLLGQDPNKGAPNAFGGAGTGAPYDPRTPGYQPGAGWQTMLRQDAMSNGADPNQYIRDRGMNPMWGSAQQPWEPAVPPGGMGLSQLLQYFRGY